jgi:DNA processing protein
VITDAAGENQRAALAILTHIGFPDPRLADLLTVLTPAEVVTLIRTGTPDQGQDLPGPAAEAISRSAGRLPSWRKALADAPEDGGVAEAARHGFRLAGPADPGWPAALDDLGPGRPCALWISGADLPPGGETVAIDGTYAPTAYGEYMAGSIAEDLAAQGSAVISGTGYGIHTAVHHMALVTDHSRPVAVLTAGPGAAFSHQAAALIEPIAARGTVITAQPPGRQSARRALHRGSLLAALSAGTVIAQMPANGSPMATARQARSLDRPLMAVPGPVTSAESAGCHALIRDGAALVTSAQDIRAVIDGHSTLADSRTAAQDSQPGPISALFGPGELECLVRTAAEAVHGSAVANDDLSRRQIDLSRRAYDALMAEYGEASG